MLTLLLHLTNYTSCQILINDLTPTFIYCYEKKLLIFGVNPADDGWMEDIVMCCLVDLDTAISSKVIVGIARGIHSTEYLNFSFYVVFWQITPRGQIFGGLGFGFEVSWSWPWQLLSLALSSICHFYFVAKCVKRRSFFSKYHSFSP